MSKKLVCFTLLLITKLRIGRFQVEFKRDLVLFQTFNEETPNKERKFAWRKFLVGTKLLRINYFNCREISLRQWNIFGHPSKRRSQRVLLKSPCKLERRWFLKLKLDLLFLLLKSHRKFSKNFEKEAQKNSIRVISVLNLAKISYLYWPTFAIL